MRGEKGRGGEGNAALCFQTVFTSPLTASVPRPSTMEAIVCLEEKAWVFFFVSIISRSLMFDMAGDQRFLWLEAGLFSVPVPLSTAIGALKAARPPP